MYQRKKHPIRTLFLVVLALLAVLAGIYWHFGGIGTGKCADADALRRYAGTLEDIVIPEEAQVVALGEATHGNAEFQELKLEMLQILVERYGVRAFVLEADYGCCEAANRYIHGGPGTAREAAAALGFAIYRTEQMEQLLDWMRWYNSGVQEGEDLRFYGNDMQRCTSSCRFLAEACAEIGMDAAPVLELVTDMGWDPAFDRETRVRRITDAKLALEEAGSCPEAIHFAETLLQNLKLGAITDDPYHVRMIEQRGKYMADNVRWVLAREQARGHARIFLCAHNGHVARYASTVDMGTLLDDALGEGYYVIGTGYYRTRCNLPGGDSGKRVVRTVYSHDPLANAGKKAGLSSFYLDFAAIPADSALTPYIADYQYMGELGEGFSLLNRLLPQSTRVFQPPATLYHGMLYVTEPTPTVIF